MQDHFDHNVGCKGRVAPFEFHSLLHGEKNQINVSVWIQSGVKHNTISAVTSVSWYSMPVKQNLKTQTTVILKSQLLMDHILKGLQNLKLESTISDIDQSHYLHFDGV